MARPLVPMGDHRTSSAPPQGQTRQAGATSRGRSGLSDRDHLRPPERYPLVDATSRDGLRLRCDLLAAAAVLAAAGHLEEALARPSRSPRSRGTDRLVEGGGGQPELSRCFWGVLTGKNPTDRAKKGSKRHLLVDGKGTPLAVRITGAQRNESLLAMPLLDDVPLIRQPRGGRRRRPDALYGDRQYGTPRNREGLKRRRIEDHLARPRTPLPSRHMSGRLTRSQKKSPTNRNTDQKRRSDLCFGRVIRTICCPAARHMSGSRERVGQDPLGRRADAVLGRASATTEDSLRQTASDPSGVPLFAVGEDLLQDPPEGFLKQFLMDSRRSLLHPRKSA